MKKETGFSLLELMIVIGIIGILAAIAYPSYVDSVRKGRRADAQSKLREFEVCAARSYTVNSNFSAVAADCLPPDEEFYGFSVTVGNPALTYTITAAPQYDQSEDPCGTMTLTQSGATSAAEAGCWFSSETASS